MAAIADALGRCRYRGLRPVRGAPISRDADRRYRPARRLLVLSIEEPRRLRRRRARHHRLRRDDAVAAGAAGSWPVRSLRAPARRWQLPPHACRRRCSGSSCRTPRLDRGPAAQRRRYRTLFARLASTASSGSPSRGRPWSHFNQFVIRRARRDELKAHLLAKGIGCSVYYPLPLHLQPCFDTSGTAGRVPGAERASRESWRCRSSRADGRRACRGRQRHR